MRSLVVFYTRTGTAKKVAEAIAKELGEDLEEIIDLQKRTGPIGYLRSGRDAGQRRLAKIQAIKYDPSQYDLVVIGTPIWSSHMTPAARTYLTQNKDKIKSLAFFTASHGMRNRKGLDELEEFYGKSTKGELELTQKEVNSGEFMTKVQQFASQLAASK